MHIPTILLDENGMPFIVYLEHDDNPPQRATESEAFALCSFTLAGFKKFKKSSIKDLSKVPPAPPEMVERAKQTFGWGD